jgi:hypothetical protein
VVVGLRRQRRQLPRVDLDQINKSNVSQLEVAWFYPLLVEIIKGSGTYANCDIGNFPDQEKPSTPACAPCFR